MKSIINKSTYLLAITAILCIMASCKRSTTTENNTIKVYSGKLYNAHDPSSNTNPNCFIDLDKGAVYSVADAKNHASDVDLYWVTTWITSTIDQPVISTTDNYNGLTGGNPYYTENQLFGGWNKRNHTTLNDIDESNMSISFNNIKTVADFEKAVENVSAPFLSGVSFSGTQSQLGRIYYFETNTNGVKKRGLLKFTAAEYSSAHSAAYNWADFQIKILP